MDVMKKLDELEAMVKPKEVDYGRIYDAIKQMDFCDLRSAFETDCAWEQSFLEREGSREAFIKARVEKNRRSGEEKRIGCNGEPSPTCKTDNDHYEIDGVQKIGKE